MRPDPELPLALPGVRELGQYGVQAPAVCLYGKHPQVFAQKPAALFFQELGGGDIGLNNPAPLVQGQEAHRGEIVKFGILAAGPFQTRQGLTQLFVLHFQFNLVHPQFMNQAVSLRP